MTGLSGVLNLRYHGTSPANLRSIATSGFTGGVLPSWAGKGAVFTSTPNVSSTYGPRQIPIVQSAKNLTVRSGIQPSLFNKIKLINCIIPNDFISNAPLP